MYFALPTNWVMDICTNASLSQCIMALPVSVKDGCDTVSESQKYMILPTIWNELNASVMH